MTKVTSGRMLTVGLLPDRMIRRSSADGSSDSDGGLALWTPSNRRISIRQSEDERRMGWGSLTKNITRGFQIVVDAAFVTWLERGKRLYNGAESTSGCNHIRQTGTESDGLPDDPSDTIRRCGLGSKQPASESDPIRSARSPS
ncbi:hypothetical protein K435DRAFT_789137 [Dendrothele bispora CBS 962.96]|uniref:Uncharacterized protein n=1 Tax=Dendrothele bispora (strain CBS 962.96) TaxID=1314807 RepID=A0A4S8MW18_DENBC|nr:hypothetical protein K435DRAFT_789137 [Dendrothele bispora CBS 962.96]